MPPTPGRLAPSPSKDQVAVIALVCYALAIGLLIAVPVAREMRETAQNRPAIIADPSWRSALVEAQELVDAPPYDPSEDARSVHVNRDWQLIGGVGVNVVTVNPKAPNVSIVLGLARGTVLSRQRFGNEGFGDMVRRFRPRVAINGTYFNLKNNEPVAALVMEGRLVSDGLASAGLYVRDDGEASIEFRRGTPGRSIGWTHDIRTAICAGPTLVRDGQVVKQARDEGFLDSAIYAEKPRSAVGVKANGKVLFVTVHTPVTLNKLSYIMLRLGAADAMNLDGGSSSALYSNGQYITLPKRNLTNLILVYD